MTDDILFETHNGTGLIVLNRPKALNALTLPMVRAMRPVFEAWTRDPAIKRMVIKGAGERAFCAGGDIRSLYDSGKAGDRAAMLAFWREEYELNILIKNSAKPYIALLDGITMGGGAGLSVHGTHRIGSEKCVFAMPEVGIGFFPDIGGSFFLSRMPDETGIYAALTGNRLNLSDALETGLLTHAVASIDMTALEQALLAGEDLDATLARFKHTPPPSALMAEKGRVSRCFGKTSVEEIVAALKADGGDWAQATLTTLATKSPSSQKLTLEQVRRGKNLSMPDCMVMEFRMVSRVPERADFYEGVRSVIVDKDNAPKWSPATLEQVDQSSIEAYFQPLGRDELVVPVL